MILVTGGTGFIGSHLLLFLTRKGLKPRAIFRDKKSIRKTKNLFELYSTQAADLFDQIEWVYGDITDISSLIPVFDGITHIYHTAALVSFDSKDKEELHQVNVEGTAANMLNLAIESNIKKFVHISSIAALGSYDNPVTEKTHWNWKGKHSEYAVTKHLAEMEAWRATQEGLPVIILNPSVVIGAGFWQNGIGKIIITKTAKGNKFYPSGGNGFVDVWDLVKIMTDLMNSLVINESFIVSAYDLSFKELMSTIAFKLNKKAPSIALPKNIAYVLALINYLLPKKFKNTLPLSFSLVRNLYRHPHYSSEKLLQVWRNNFIPFEASITNIIAQYKKSNL